MSKNSTWKHLVAATLGATFTLELCELSQPAFAQSVPSAQTLGNKDESAIKKNTDELLKGLISDFDKAIASLNATNETLDRANDLKNYGDALGIVDTLIDKTKAFADRLAPGNPTETRIKKTLSQIADLANYLSNAGLDKETLDRTLQSLSRESNRLTKGLEIFASFHPELASLLEELRQKRRGVAAEIMVAAFGRAADSLEDTNKSIRDLIDKLKNFVNTFRAIPTS